MCVCVSVCECSVFVETIWSGRNGPDRNIPVATATSEAAVGAEARAATVVVGATTAGFPGKLCQKESLQGQHCSGNGYSSMAITMVN